MSDSIHIGSRVYRVAPMLKVSGGALYTQSGSTLTTAINITLAVFDKILIYYFSM